MARRLRLLLGLLVAVAMTLAVSAPAMPMGWQAPVAATQHCSHCVPPSHGSNKPLPCPGLFCAAPAVAIATVPNVRAPAVRRNTYRRHALTAWTAAIRAPDPFPPRPVDLD